MIERNVTTAKNGTTKKKNVVRKKIVMVKKYIIPEENAMVKKVWLILSRNISSQSPSM